MWRAKGQAAQNACACTWPGGASAAPNSPPSHRAPVINGRARTLWCTTRYDTHEPATRRPSASSTFARAPAHYAQPHRPGTCAGSSFHRAAACSLHRAPAPTPGAPYYWQQLTAPSTISLHSRKSAPPPRAVSCSVSRRQSPRAPVAARVAQRPSEYRGGAGAIRRRAVHDGARGRARACQQRSVCTCASSGSSGGQGVRTWNPVRHHGRRVTRVHSTRRRSEWAAAGSTRRRRQPYCYHQ